MFVSGATSVESPAAANTSRISAAVSGELRKFLVLWTPVAMRSGVQPFLFLRFQMSIVAPYCILDELFPLRVGSRGSVRGREESCFGELSSGECFEFFGGVEFEELA